MYRRVSEQQLAEAMGDAEVAERLVSQTRFPELSLYIGVDWGAVGYLLEAAEGPVEVVFGLETMSTLACGVKHLTVEQVRCAAEWLSAIGFDELMDSLDPQDPRRREVYKLNLDYPAHVDWLRESYAQLVLFFAAAARSGEAVLILLA